MGISDFIFNAVQKHVFVTTTGKKITSFDCATK